MRSYRWWGWLPVLAVLGAIGGAAVWVNLLPDGHEEPVHESPTARGAPVPCGDDHCFPGAELATVRRELEATGATCAGDVRGFALGCYATQPGHGWTLLVGAADQAPERVRAVKVMASGGDERRVRAILDQELGRVLPMFLPAFGDVAAALADQGHGLLGQCMPLSLGPVVPPGYRVTCENPEPERGKPGTVVATVGFAAHLPM